MMQGRTLPDLAAELARQAERKRDFLAPARLLTVRSNGTTHLLAQEPFAVGEIAHGQLAEYLGVPKGFYDRLRNAAADLTVPVPPGIGEAAPMDRPLFDVIVNRLLAGKGDDARLVRTLDGSARAFLSDSFSTDLDNFDVFCAAVRAFEEAGLGPENIASCEVTERKLYLKVVSPKLEAEIRPGNLHREHGGHFLLKEPQTVQAGFILSNSETGLGSLSVQQVVYKLKCTNLWIAEEGYRQRHLGRALESGEGGPRPSSATEGLPSGWTGLTGTCPCWPSPWSSRVARTGACVPTACWCFASRWTRRGRCTTAACAPRS